MGHGICGPPSQRKARIRGTRHSRLTMRHCYPRIPAMKNYTASARCRCSAMLIAAMFVALLPVGSSAAQGEPPKSTDAAKQSAGEKPAELRQDVTREHSELVLREEGSQVSRYELVTKEELSRLRTEAENNKKRWWVLDAPWAALLIIGLVWIWTWRSQNEQQFQLQQEKLRQKIPNWEEDARFNALGEMLTKMQEQVSGMSQNMREATDSISALWRTLATSNLVISGQRDTKKWPWCK